MELAILHFSVRCDAAIPLAEMSDRVADALGCKLEKDSYHQIPATRGKLLGMDVALFEWGGVKGRTFRLQGDVEDISFLDFQQENSLSIAAQDISHAVADALTVLTGFPWRTPTPEDIIAEKVYGDDVEKNFSSIP